MKTLQKRDEIRIHWRIQHYCKMHNGEHSQKSIIKMHHNVLLIISCENFAVPLYTPLEI